MNKKLSCFFILLSLVALLVIGYDYACGHMGESPLKPDECPICASFNATEFVQLLLFALLLLGIFPLIGLFSFYFSFSPIALYYSVLSNRSPPLAV